MGKKDEEEKVQIKVDNVSEGKLCPFMMAMNAGAFTTKPTRSHCAGDMCALFQSFDYPVPLMEDGKPVREKYTNEDGEEAEGIKIDYIHRLQGCSMLLGTTFQNQASAACGKMENYGANLLMHFQQMALARKAAQSPSGLSLPPGMHSRPAG